jgi:hypothetical protein
MTNKTWFLPPGFTFLPDGQIALGSIIPHPRQPTVTLASLDDYPDIALPEVKSIVEKNLSFSEKKSRSFGLKLFAKFLDIANTEMNMSRYKSTSFSTVDHEVRAYNGAFALETLKAIVALDNVKKHINTGRFGKRCVYIISGLRVAQQSFKVINEQANKTATSLGVSGPMPSGTALAVLGANAAFTMDYNTNNSYETAPGIVFAYQVHVIRPKDTGEEDELFSDRTAFFSGEADDEEVEELEAVGVNGVILRQDLDAPLDDYDEKRFEEADDKSYIVFKYPLEKASYK